MTDKSDAGKSLNNIKVGLAVEIFLKEDRSHKNPVSGVVAEILTHTSYHPHGIMVRLEDGSIGRIHKILSDVPHSSVGTTPPPKKDLDIAELVKTGENEFVEFKSGAFWSKNFTDQQLKDSSAPKVVKAFGKEASKVIIAKGISGFLNTQGGNLVIGVKENKTQNPDEIIGIECEFGKLEDSCTDGYRRMLVDSIIRKYFHPDIYNHFSDYIQITFPELEGKIICWIKITKSDVPAFVTIQKNDYFYIRLDAETRKLEGKEMVEYCSRRFD